jgi:bifunctional non-homologous end joining protein LigD
MPLVPMRQPFNNDEWLFEPKWDGFRALAYLEGDGAHLVSRWGHTYKSWPSLMEELAQAVRCRSAVLDGEICCLEPGGRSNFYKLLFRREPPHFMVFDLLWLNGRDLRKRPLHERRRKLARIMPRVESRVRLVESLESRGEDFFRVACAHDLEGIVAKWRNGTYLTDGRTSWLKIRNPEYSQWEHRRELFEARRDRAQRARDWVRPQFALA